MGQINYDSESLKDESTFLKQVKNSIFPGCSNINIDRGNDLQHTYGDLGVSFASTITSFNNLKNAFDITIEYCDNKVPNIINGTDKSINSNISNGKKINGDVSLKSSKKNSKEKFDNLTGSMVSTSGVASITSLGFGLGNTNSTSNGSGYNSIIGRGGNTKPGSNKSGTNSVIGGNSSNDSNNTVTVPNTQINNQSNDGITITPLTSETKVNNPYNGRVSYSGSSNTVNGGASNVQPNNSVNNDNTPITDTKFNRNTKDLFEDLDDTTDTVGTDKSTGGNALGVTLGVGAAIGAATVGAKVYKEHKENSDLDLNPDRPSNENKFWTDEDANVIHSEKEEFEIEDKNNNINEEVGNTLIEESSIPTAYQATSNNIKEEEEIDTNVDTWSMPSDNVNLFEE